MSKSNESVRTLELRQRVAGLPGVSMKKMFGYDCYCINRKFFAGFSIGNNSKVIIKLPKNEQQRALENTKIKPFSHGAKSGWIEVELASSSGSDTHSSIVEDAYTWVEKSYNYVLNFPNISKSTMNPHN